jgi:hypothetical protein
MEAFTMRLQLSIQLLDPSSPKSGFTCCICGELSFEKAACVVLSDEHKTYGNVCMNCVASGQKKATATAYDLACGMRQVSDRQFHIASKISEINATDWITFDELMQAKKIAKK